MAQPPPTKFGTMVEPRGPNFGRKARWDRTNRFFAVEDEVLGKSAKIGTLWRVPSLLAKKRIPGPPFFIAPLHRGVSPLPKGEKKYHEHPLDFLLLSVKCCSSYTAQIPLFEFEPPYLGRGSTAPNQIWHDGRAPRAALWLQSTMGSNEPLLCRRRLSAR